MKTQPTVTSPKDSTPHPDPRIERAREVVRLEAKTIAGLEERLDEGFTTACDEILGCEGHVVVSGMGKAGLVGQKISATLASTGTPSIFLPPGEALFRPSRRSSETILSVSFATSVVVDRAVQAATAAAMEPSSKFELKRKLD